MRKAALLALGAAAGLAAGACNPVALIANASAKKQVAEHATGRFRSQLDSGRFDQIYSEADPDFRRAVTKADADDLWTMVQRRFGARRGTALVDWNVSATAGNGTQVRLTYRTAFATDSATETFNWRIRDDRPSLIGYNINSPALLRAMTRDR